MMVQDICERSLAVCKNQWYNSGFSESDAVWQEGEWGVKNSVKKSVNLVASYKNIKARLVNEFSAYICLFCDYFFWSIGQTEISELSCNSSLIRFLHFNLAFNKFTHLLNKWHHFENNRNTHSTPSTQTFFVNHLSMQFFF